MLIARISPGVGVWVLLLVLAVLAGAPLAIRALQRRRRRIVETVARHVQGRLLSGAGGDESVSSVPRNPTAIAFRYAGGEAVLEFGFGRTLGRRRPLRLVMPWPDKELWCEVRPRYLSRRLDGIWKHQRVSSGDANFDKMYIARGAPAEKVELLLSAAVRISLNQLRYLYDSNHIDVRWCNGALIVTKHALSRHPSTMIRFVQLGLELYDQAQLLQSAELSFVAAAAGEAAASDLHAAASCRVCGEAFIGKIVFCRTCRTPHHRDCWKYFGGCATYGCGGRQFKRGRAPAG